MNTQTAKLLSGATPEFGQPAVVLRLPNVAPDGAGVVLEIGPEATALEREAPAELDAVRSEPTIAPAARHRVRAQARKRHVGAEANGLPWHLRPAVREWISKLTSGGIVALLVLALAGYCFLPRKSKLEQIAHPEAPTAAKEIPALGDEPLIRQAKRELPPASLSSPPMAPGVERGALPPPLESSPREPAPRLELSAPRVELSVPSMEPSSPGVELSAPQQNEAPREEILPYPTTDPTTYRYPASTPVFERMPGAGDAVPRTATLRGTIAPPPPRVR